MNPSPFHSSVVEAAIDRTAAAIADPELRLLFRNSAANTLATTIAYSSARQTRSGREDTFVITGDIPAMWLRDSAGQMNPYLRFAAQDETLAAVFRGLIHRHTACLLQDEYANAFLFDATETSEHVSDVTQMRPGVHERKYEIDSAAYAIRLAHGYWARTGDTSALTEDWRNAMHRVLALWRREQRHETESGYVFLRPGAPPSDTLSFEGHGHPCAQGCGMTWCGFRPSDDACELPYHVPSNAFACVALRQLAALADRIEDSELARNATVLAHEIYSGIMRLARVRRDDTGEYLYAYEVDGLGGHSLMDDANVPSLLSLPYLGFCAPDDPLYQATRRFVLSQANIYFQQGRVAEGVGSPHTDVHFKPGCVWPMSLVMQAMTAREDDEIRGCLRQLARLHGGTYLMHESVDPNDSSSYSRAWFAWANSLLAELVWHLHTQRPQVLARAD